MATGAPKTPKSTSRSASLSTSTPIVPSTGCQPQSASTGQKELKHNIKLEYFGHVYKSDRLFEKIYRNTLSSTSIDQVTQDCIEQFKSLAIFPPPSQSEKHHYDPFVARLNTIKDCLYRRGLMKGSIFEHNVRFENYNQEMLEGVARDAPLKPDILARIAPESAEQPASWHDVELCAEVKGQYPEMVAQGATYARSISYMQRSRRFVLVIFYEQTKRLVSFGLFTAGWLCLSAKGHNLRKDEGQRGFIRDMIRIWSCKDRWSAGFDETCNNVQCFLGREHGTFSYLGNICYRISLRGRRTRVDLVGDISNDAREVLSQNEYVLRRLEGYNEYYASDVPKVQAAPQSEGQGRSLPRRSSRFQSLASAGAEESSKALTGGEEIIRKLKSLNMNGKSTTNSPSFLPVHFQTSKHVKFILKDSWPLFSRRKREVEVFGNIGSKFGVPTILAFYEVPVGNGTATDTVSDTTSVLPSDWKWHDKLWKDAFGRFDSSTSQSQKGSKQSSHMNQEYEPEHRVHVRLLIGTEGAPLENAKSPRELVLAVLHAMIGYRVVFKEGWLHRDVSIGNVLLMKTPEKRDRIEGFDSILTEDIRAKYFERCTGFISDGDLAVKWDGDTDREFARQRSGTPPFMSYALLTAIVRNTDVYHSVIDDLESFVWVLFWAVLSLMKHHGLTFTPIENYYWLCLQSRDLNHLIKKGSFSVELFQQEVALMEQKEQKPGDPPVENLPSPAFGSLVGLLREWLELAISNETSMARHRSKRAPNTYEKIMESWIEKYLTIGLKHMESLPDTAWKSLR